MNARASYRLRTVDNCQSIPVRERWTPESSNPEVAESLLTLLRRYADHTAEEFSAQGATILHSTKYNHDDGERSPVFTLHAAESSEPLLSTGNTMGVLRLRNEAGLEITLEIGSRFDAAENQYFLNYLLCRVFGGRFVDPVQISRSSLWDLLLVLVFRERLVDAFAQGLFKRYVRREYNDDRFRGSVNLSRHLRRNVPFHGAIAYTTHELSCDTPVARLVRSALQYVEGKFPWLLGNSRQEVAEARQAIERNTPSWRAGSLPAILKENGQPIRHPYFTAYEPLRRASLAVLADEGAALYDEPSTDEIEGVLFDGAWLWEQYLATLLESLGFKHHQYESGQGLPVFKDGSYQFFPDFHHPSENIVLDAKYKRGAARQDYHQVLAYMLLTGARRGGVIRPPDGRLDSTPQRLAIASGIEKSFWAASDRAWWHDIVFHAPLGSLSAAEFLAGMVASEADLRAQITLCFEFP